MENRNDNTIQGNNTDFAISCWQQHYDHPDSKVIVPEVKEEVTNASNAKRIRQVVAKMEAKRQYDEHQSYLLEFAANHDVDVYKHNLIIEREQSLHDNNIYAFKQRKLQAIADGKQNQIDHNNYELKWAGERDVALYNKEEKEKRRLDFVLNNDIAHNIRKYNAIHDAIQQKNEHLSYELERKADHDVDVYKSHQSHVIRMK